MFSLNQREQHHVQPANQCERAAQPRPGLPVPVGAIPGAVGHVAFGSYLSPDYEVHPGEYIPQVGRPARGIRSFSP